MSTRRTALLLALGLGTVAWAPRSASAQATDSTASTETGDDARSLFLRGQTAYSQGDYEDAASLWERAFALDPRVGLQYNLSQAYERIGRLEDAAASLQRYVDGTTPDDARLSDARARLAAIRERIARTSVLVEGGPEGAVLLVDDADRGRLPRPDALTVPAGSHTIRVRAPGFEDFVASVAVPAGQTVEVHVLMARTASTSSSSIPVGPIVTITAGGVVLATGLVIGAVALGQASGATSRTGSEADSARSLALASDVLWVTGAVAASAGVVWLITELSASPTPSDRAFQLVPYASPSGGGAVLAGSF